MTFIVKTAATLRLADGSSFDLVAGMHDDFPANVKNHWAFASYAERVDTSKQDVADQKGTTAAKKQIKQLQEQLKAKDALLDEKEVEIAEQVVNIDQLKARVTELESLAADNEALMARIAELEKPATETDDGSKSRTDKPEGEKKDDKKQQASDS
ncbi:hypothetical protein DEO48_25170 [Enterobacter sp. CGMCC 5087]|uniref:hypothetical protein n=1 Tax=Enterobacter sp. CGMCC 5087 TaxID=2183878 RepID=UPI000D681012|nr:hypothetical protein [Enterobacter sp. CGMCC 5087]PWI77259.1 hypothetical protein DEO48_25170 [Enterobacter sp. CGMCC 5087]